MAYEQRKIAELLNDVVAKNIVLPSIQRTFVWNEKKVCKLFDSLLKRYPIGEFIFWSVNDQDQRNYVFREFITDVDKNEELIRGPKITPRMGATVKSVLDGQQRITSLLIGLKGSYTVKSNTSVKKYLALNLMRSVTNPVSESYDFAFVPEENLNRFIDETGAYWFKVADILDVSLDENIQRLPGQYHKQMSQVLIALFQALEFAQISFYTIEQGRPLGEIAQIFERINNGGQVLTGVDLLLSLQSAVAVDDMQEGIVKAIQQIEEDVPEGAFVPPNKEFVYTAALYVTDAENISPTSAINYSRSDLVSKINENWEAIVQAITNASKFMHSLGISKGIPRSSIYPVVYYFYNLRDKGNRRFESSSEYARKDMVSIAEWFIRVMTTHLFVDGSGATLIKIRNVLKAQLGKHKPETLVFPLGKLIEEFDSTARTLRVSSYDIDELLDSKYSDSQTHTLLRLITKVDASTDYHKDHIWPAAKMRTKTTIKKLLVQEGWDIDARLEEEVLYYQDHYNDISNIQLITERWNKEKGDMLYKEWMDTVGKDQSSYKDDQCIPNVDYRYSNFREFLAKRKELLRNRLEKLFK